MNSVSPRTFREAYHPEEMDFQQYDVDCLWLNHNPENEWTPDDQKNWEREEAMALEARLGEQLANAFFWDLEGVRCATFGRDPNQNPYVDNE